MDNYIEQLEARNEQLEKKVEELETSLGAAVDYLKVIQLMGVPVDWTNIDPNHGKHDNWKPVEKGNPMLQWDMKKDD